MIRFGPSGNSRGFYEAGFKRTLEAPKWLSQMGLNAYEYSFGRGVNMSDETAKEIGNEMKKYNIEISVHAPYYINLANPDDEKAQNSFRYVLQSLQKLSVLGGSRCVMHSGTTGSLERPQAIALIYKRMELLLNVIEQQGYNNLILCPETMGKYSQIGTVEEISELCKIHPMLIPCLDFGHINSYMQGGLKTKDDFRRVLDVVFNTLGEDKAKRIHIHFSKIKYGPAGEIHHLNMDDDIYGPEFEPLAELLKEYQMSPVILSESADMMAEDAYKLKQIYETI